MRKCRYRAKVLVEVYENEETQVKMSDEEIKNAIEGSLCGIPEELEEYSKQMQICELTTDGEVDFLLM